MENCINFCDKRHWLRLWRGLGVCSVDKIFNAYIDLLERYNEPHRKYHNLGHINHCLAELNSVWLWTEEPSVLALAIWYHDAIYDIGANDNEERSADLVEGVMRDFLLAEDLITKVRDIIIATKHLEVPKSFDAKLMLDIDISNIGSADKFKETNKLVREEYSFAPENAFNSGRSNILQSFLDRPSIYLTEFFQEKYEKTARENIEKAINNLYS
ncbi:MAG: N-methyl-D-aspartate receptor NMDAR2C subunit [Patescibacteria group bacterium]